MSALPQPPRSGRGQRGLADRSVLAEKRQLNHRDTENKEEMPLHFCDPIFLTQTMPITGPLGLAPINQEEFAKLDQQEVNLRGKKIQLASLTR